VLSVLVYSVSDTHCSQRMISSSRRQFKPILAGLGQVWSRVRISDPECDLVCVLVAVFVPGIVVALSAADK